MTAPRWLIRAARFVVRVAERVVTGKPRVGDAEGRKERVRKKGVEKR